MKIETIEDIRKTLPNVASEVSFKDFAPHITTAEDWISEDILGSVIYNAIEDDSISEAKIIRLTSNIIILKAYELGIPFMDLVQTSAGFGVVSDKNRSPASKQRVDRLIAQNSLLLNETVERLINHLEDNPIYHNDWKSSPAYSLLSECVINTVREFKRYASYTGSRADFLMLKPKLLNVISLQLFPAISRNYTKELIAKQNTNTLTDKDKEILPAIKQAIANYGIDNPLIADRLLDDVVTIIDKDSIGYPTYHGSSEKMLKDDPGFLNTADTPFFVSKGGM